MTKVGHNSVQKLSKVKNIARHRNPSDMAVISLYTGPSSLSESKQPSQTFTMHHHSPILLF